MIIAVKETGQALQGNYKFRHLQLEDLESTNRNGGSAKGTISFAYGTATGSATLFQEGGTQNIALSGTYAYSVDGYALAVGMGPQQHYNLNLSPQGELMIGTRGESEGEHERQAFLIGLRENEQRYFSDLDFSGTWRVGTFELSDIESNSDRAAELCLATITAASGQGNLQFTCTDSFLNEDSQGASFTYTVKSNGEFDLYLAEDQSPLVTGNISGDGNFIILGSDDAAAQQVMMGMKRTPGKVYSLADINGTYRWQLIRVRNFSSATPRSWFGYGTYNFDGAGNWTAYATRIYASDGQVLAPAGQSSGTYSVTPDGEITMNPTSGGLGPGEVRRGYISNDNGTIVLTWTFPSPTSAKFGSLQVFIEPQEARNAGAQWRIVGRSQWRASGQKEDGIPVGGHKVEFSSLTGWTKPADADVTVQENEMTTFTGVYTSLSGTLIVNVDPDNASWGISGPAGFEGNGVIYAGDRTFQSAPPGSYTWTGQPLMHYNTPSAQTATLSAGGTLIFTKSWSQIPPPTASFTMTPARGQSPLHVSFQDTSNGDINSWNWSFGDGGISADRHPQHTYNDIGVYQVTLQVTGPGGQRSASGTVLVYNAYYVNKDDDKCGGKSPCRTKLQDAIKETDQVKFIRVTQGSYPEEILQSVNNIAIIQGGNDETFSDNPPSRTTIKKLDVTGGTVMPENLNIGPN
jgi:PKD repeat protein